MAVTHIMKRDGTIVPFDRKRIENAMYAAARAVGNGEGRPWAETLSWAVVAILNERLNGADRIPHVEEIQDIVEEVLVKSGNPKVAKAYILYRQKRAEARATERMLLDAEKLVEDYLQRADWRVNENSNMNYSLQGLNFYLASSIAARYWLQKVYPPEVQQAHITGDVHIHDLGMLSTYCCGWDLLDLLEQGFGGVPAKIESRPPRHLRTALGQLVNFFYTLQGESAGAVAVSNFDTLMAPFVRHDGLDYTQVKQAIQEFIFNINVPTRVGFQCLSEDTEILTPAGWKGYDEIEVGDLIKTFNIQTGIIETQPVLKIFARPYNGPMYRLRNRIQDQLISPGHRVVRKKFNTDNVFVLEPVEDVRAYKSPVIVPIIGTNCNPPKAISDDEIRLLAWIIAEGSKESYTKHRHSHRISIYQSRIASPESYAEIIELLERLHLDYNVRDSTAALGESVQMIRLTAESSHRILDTLFQTRENIKFVPDILKNMDRRQARLFLDTYLKADGHEGCKITTSDIEILDGLQQIAVDAEYAFTVGMRQPTIGKKPLYILRLIDHRDTYIQKIEVIDYSGVIWCPTTENQTVIARRNGKVFVTGNTPFTNVTMDLTAPPTLADEPVIIGGEMQSATYGEFQQEMDMLNRAFAEVMLEGDAKGRVFTFPIPTYNISKDFHWDNPDLAPIWAMTAKYGIPYFANFINSDMKPEDARSMCLFPTETMLVRENGVIRKTTIGELFATCSDRCIDGAWFTVNRKVEALSLNPDTGHVEWTPVIRFLRVSDRELVTIRTRDGKTMRVSSNHLVAVFTEEGIRTKRAKDVVKEDLLLVLKDGSSALSEGTPLDPDLAWFMGFFVADGNYLYDTRYAEKRLRGVQFSFDARNQNLPEKVRTLVKKFADYDMKFTQDPRYPNSLRGYVFSRSFANLLSEEYDVRKYGGLPGWIWSASPSVIETFLQGFFDGDGYQEGKEIHINDAELARELNLLMQLVGISTTYSVHERSQTIRIQHTLGRAASGRKVIRDRLHNMVPQFLMDKKHVKDEHKRTLYQAYGCKMVGLSSIDRWGLSNEKIERLRNAAFAVVPIADLQRETLAGEQVFYDVELENNHYFVHSDGNITHNCCRLRLDNRELRKRVGGLFAAAPLTGSVGVVTLNMARLGYLARDEQDFRERLERLMETARTSLEIKRKMLETFTERGLYPYSYYFLRMVKARSGKFWSNHFSTIGLNGMHEASLNLFGVGIDHPDGHAFAIRTLHFMRDVLMRFQEETGHLYNLEATPAEGASYRLARADKERYPDIKTSGTEVAPYYTNSTQLPVDFSDDLFEVLDHQDELQTLYTGGTVLHIFLGEQLDSWQQARRLVRTVAENYRLPYYTLTPTFSICPVHGYIPGAHPYCPYEHTEEQLKRFGRPVTRE